MPEWNKKPHLLVGTLAGIFVLAGLAALYLLREKPATPHEDDSEAGQTAQSHENKANREIQPVGSPPRFVASPSPKLAIGEPTAILAFRKQRDLGGRVLTPAKLHADEPRDPVWAAAMETELRKRLNEEAFKALGLDSVEVDELDCRTSSCKVMISWDKATQPTVENLLANTNHQIKTPLGLMHLATGPLGSMSQSVPPAGQRVPIGAHGATLPNGRLSIGQVLLFGEGNMDPDAYSAWVEKLHAGNQEKMNALKDWPQQN